MSENHPPIAPLQEATSNATDMIPPLQIVPSHQRPEGELSEAQSTPESARNIHQRVAVQTHDWLTLANVATATGGLLSANGLREYCRGNRVKALGYVGVGRLFDLADGAIAERCGTRSETGALLDAGTDKLLTIAAGAVLVRQRTISPTYAMATVVDQGRIAYQNMQIKKAHGEPNPSVDGKRAMATLWVGLGLRAAEQITEQKHPTASKILGVVALAAEGATLALAERAIRGYKTQRKQLVQS